MASHGHRSPITTVDAHGAHVVSGGYDGRVICRENRRATWSYQAADLINSVRFDKSASRIAVGCADGFVHVLDRATGGLLAKLGPHGDDVECAAWGADGETIVSSCTSWDPRVYVWRVKGPHRLRVLEGPSDAVLSVCVSPDGRRIAAAAEDHHAWVWDAGGRLLRSLRHPGDPTSADWSSCGRYLATGCDDGVLRVFEPETGALLHADTSATGAVRAVRFSNDGKRLASGSYDNSVRIYEVGSFRLLDTLKGRFQWERGIAFTDTGLVVGSFGTDPIFHDAGAAPTDAGRTVGINKLRALTAYGEDNVLVGRDDGSVFDVTQGAVLHRHESIVNGVDFDPSGRYVVSVDYEGGICVYDREAADVVATTRLGSGPINSGVFLGSEDRIATAGYDGVIRFFSRDLELLAERDEHDGAIKALAWSPTSGVLLAGSTDRTVTGWRDGEPVFRTKECGDLINDVAASPARPEVAVVSRELVARIWSTDDGRAVDAFPAVHTKSVKGVSFDTRGADLVTVGYDARAVLWTRKPRGGWEHRLLEAHAKPGVPTAAFSPTALYTGGWDGVVARWSLAGELEHRYEA